MSTFKLPRTGDRPLQFEGELIAKADSRWVELALYRTASAKYVAAIVHRAQGQGEPSRDEAHVCVNIADIAKAMAFVRVNVHVKCAHVEAAVRQRYEHAASELERAVGKLLEHVGPESI